MANQRTKLCSNCEGRVELDTTICPFCGSNVSQMDDGLHNQKADENSLSYEDTLSSLYPPPYKPKAIDTNINISTNNFDKTIKEDGVSENEEEKSSNSLVTTISFLIGVNILTFSLFLAIFSQDGYLSLEFKSSFWFIYSLISIPLLYIGYKGLKEI
jgi:hypothetical protein